MRAFPESRPLIWKSEVLLHIPGNATYVCHLNESINNRVVILISGSRELFLLSLKEAHRECHEFTGNRASLHRFTCYLIACLVLGLGIDIPKTWARSTKVLFFYSHPWVSLLGGMLLLALCGWGALRLVRG